MQEEKQEQSEVQDDVIFIDEVEAQAQREYTKSSVDLVRKICSDSEKAILADLGDKFVAVQAMLDTCNNTIQRQEKALEKEATINKQQQQQLDELQEALAKEKQAKKNAESKSASMESALQSKKTENQNLVADIKKLKMDLAEQKKVNDANKKTIADNTAQIETIKLATGDKDALQKVETVVNVLKKFGNLTSDI